MMLDMVAIGDIGAIILTTKEVLISVKGHDGSDNDHEVMMAIMPD